MTILRDISFLWSMLHVVALFLLLFEPRFSWRTTLTISFAGAGTLLVANVLAMYWMGHGIIMGLSFFTCTIPTLILFFLLSKYRDGRFLFLFCLTDTVCFWLLQLTNLLDRLTGGTYVTLLITRLILFPALEFFFWRYLRRPYLELQSKLRRGWWLFAGTGAVYYLLIMFTAIPVDAPMPDLSGLIQILLVMILMPMTYLTIFHSLWQQIQVFESTRQVELQQRDYDAVCQKMELSRIYRHDMRHHLAVMSGMLQQGDSGNLQQYIQDLSGKLDGLTQVTWCANAAVNAVLSTYINHAEREGCTMDVKIRVPAELPYEETDLCVILANGLENAIHACQSLPKAERRITFEMELTDNQRLTAAICNPCPKPVKFDPDGLPAVIHAEGHGLGLRSIQVVTRKYNGLFRCQWENGQFELQTVLFPPVSIEQAPKVHSGNQVATIFLTVILCLVVLNCVPVLADALESIPVLGLIIQIFDLRSYLPG